MLSLSSLRRVCSSRAALHPHRLTAKRPPISQAAVTCVCSSDSSSSSFSFSSFSPSRDTWPGGVSPGAAGRERGPTYYTEQANSPRSYCAGQVKLNCWKCKEPLDRTPTFFCVSCKAVQPPEEETSYFKIMDCDYTFTLDTQKLQKRYLQLQRSLHPDNFSQSSVKEQEYSESQSAFVNKAYKTLLKPLSRGLYMLELEGMRIEEGTDSEADLDFLMELMEINEALDEAQTPEKANKIGQDTKGKLADLTEQIDTALRKGELQTAKALLAQMKYYANIEEKVKEKLSEFM